MIKFLIGKFTLLKWSYFIHIWRLKITYLQLMKYYFLISYDTIKIYVFMSYRKLRRLTKKWNIVVDLFVNYAYCGSVRPLRVFLFMGVYNKQTNKQKNNKEMAGSGSAGIQGPCRFGVKPSKNRISLRHPLSDCWWMKR